MELMTDAQLAVLSQHGDKHAFELLARRWQRRLLLFLKRWSGNADEANDTCQEALLKAFVRIRSLQQPENFGTWLHRIALNVARDRGRSQRRSSLRLVALEDQPLDDLVSSGPSPIENAERAESGANVRRLVARLPEQQRTAILLRELEGFTSEEIGVITGAPATTVRSRIFHGLRSLRRAVLEHGLAPAEGGFCND